MKKFLIAAAACIALSSNAAYVATPPKALNVPGIVQQAMKECVQYNKQGDKIVFIYDKGECFERNGTNARYVGDFVTKWYNYFDLTIFMKEYKQ